MTQWANIIFIFYCWDFDGFGEISESKFHDYLKEKFRYFVLLEFMRGLLEIYQLTIIYSITLFLQRLNYEALFQSLIVSVTMIKIH